MISLPSQVLELNGADAAAFAHAQFSNDVLALPDGHWQWSTWLSPQGRVRAFFHLSRRATDYIVLTLRGGDATWLHAELSRFVFRAKVQLRAASGGAAQTSTLDDIRAGIPEIGAELRDQFLPQWLGLDHLGAVSVSKGCYPGQEIMARLHFKGGNKRSLYRLRWRGDAVPSPGTSVRDDNAAEAGIVVTAARDVEAGCVEALASLSDAAASAALKLESSSACAVGVVQRFA